MTTSEGLIVCAATPNAEAARGKQVLYVYNRTKLEKMFAIPSADPARIARFKTQGSNDEKVIAVLQSLYFVVQGIDQYSSVDLAKGKDLILISESVGALDLGSKYRNVAVPPITFEDDLLPYLGMTGVKTDVDARSTRKGAADLDFEFS